MTSKDDPRSPDQTDNDSPQDPQLWYLVIGGLLSVITIADNGAVIYLILTKRRLHTTANWFVLSLAFADLLVGAGLFLSTCLCVSPLCSIDLQYVINSFFIALSATNLCAMTIDRYLAVVKPMLYYTFMTTKRVVLFISTAWLLPFLAHLLLFIFICVKTSTRKNRVSEMASNFAVFDFVVFEILPLLLLVLASGHIFLIVREHSRRRAKRLAQLRFNYTIENSTTTAQITEISSAKVVGAAVSVFIICYISEPCYTVLYEFPGTTQNNAVFTSILWLLFIFSSAVNPFAYAIFKSDIKRSLKGMFHRTRGN